MPNNILKDARANGLPETLLRYVLKVESNTSTKKCLGALLYYLQPTIIAFGFCISILLQLIHRKERWICLNWSNINVSLWCINCVEKDTDFFLCQNAHMFRWHWVLLKKISTSFLEYVILRPKALIPVPSFVISPSVHHKIVSLFKYYGAPKEVAVV